MKQAARSFKRRHPLSLQEIIAAPAIFREYVPDLSGLPFPRAAVIHDLAAFAGFSPGAVRTAMSRLRAAGELESFIDEAGVTQSQKTISGVVRAWPERPEGFLIGVFSFRAPEEAERRAVRETLRHFGFKRFAQNTYINGMIDTAGLETEMRNAGVADRFYVFRCPQIDDPALLRRLAEVFDVKGRMRALAGFRKELKAFLEEPGIDRMEFGRRLFYAGPVHHRVCFVEEPPVPARILPPGYPLAELWSYLDSLVKKRRGGLTHYYRTLCE